MSNIHKIRPKGMPKENTDKNGVVYEAVSSENKEAAQTQFGGGTVGHKNDAVVVENVDNGYIVRVVCAALEQETVMVFTHEQRGDLLQFLASAV